MACVTIGDSIAIGLAQAMRCMDFAKVGRTARQQAAIMTRIGADRVVISLGSNDADDAFLVRDLRTVRNGITSGDVVWIVPYNLRAAELVRHVAREHGDRMVELGDHVSQDRVHPYSYQEVARRVRQ